MARSVKKGPFVDQHLLAKASKLPATLVAPPSSRHGVVAR